MTNIEDLPLKSRLSGDEIVPLHDPALPDPDANAAARISVVRSSWRTVTGGVTALPGERLQVDSSSSSSTITLPASPADGTEVRIVRLGAQPVTISSGAQFFGGGISAIDLPDNTEVALVYRGGAWQVTATISYPPTWLPYLATEFLNFRDRVYWTGGASRSSLSSAFAAAGFSFSRATQAARYDVSGVLGYAASGAARLDYHPVSHQALGLLLERAMTPLTTNGESFDNAYWSKTRNATGTPAANADGAPDGATTADRFVPDSSTSSSIAIYKPLSITSGVRHSLSIFAKPDAGNGVRRLVVGMFWSSLLRCSWTDVATGAAGSVANGGTAWARAGGAGFTRAGYSTTPSTASVQVNFQPATSDGNLSFTGDSTKYVTIWGAQFEQGDFPTSYNAGAARAADILTRSIASPAQFTREIGFTAPPGLSTNVVWQMDDGGENNRVRLYRDNTGAVRLVVTVSGADTVNLTLGTVANESFNRAAITYDGTSFRAVMNANPTVSTAVSAMPTITTERIGSSATAGEEWCGWISEFTCYGSMTDRALREASRVFPAWVLTDSANGPANIYMDFVNGRYWANSRVYPTLGELQSALGATTYVEGDWTFPWTDPSVSLMLEVLPDSGTSLGRTSTFVSIDNGASGRYQKAYLSSGNAIGGRAYWGSNQWFQEASDLLQKYWPTRFALTFQTNNFSLSKEGKAPYTQTTGTDIGAPATFRVGNNFARTEGLVDGQIWKLAVFQTPKSSSEVQALANANWPMIAEGDSYVAGAGNVGLVQSIARLRRRLVLDSAIGGSTLADQVTRATTNIPAWPNAIFLHWDGDNNGYGTNLSDDVANYTTMANLVLANGHSKFVFVLPLKRTGQSSGQRARIDALGPALSALWPGHVLDALPIVQSLSDGSPGDEADIAAGCAPRSQFQDGVHLVQGAMDLVASTGVLPIIDANGWLAPE